MHAKIFQLSKKELNTSDFISEHDFLNTEMWEIITSKTCADYVSELNDTERIRVLQSINGSPSGMYYNEIDNTLRVFDAKEYFKAKYQGFLEDIQKLSAITLDSFSTSQNDFQIRSDIYSLRTNFDDEIGTYMILDGCAISMDKFVRMSQGETFYVGTVFDFHF